jgi:hypothetical protein
MDSQEEHRKTSLYDIEETERFLEQVQGLIGSVKEWDDIKATIDCDLARDPLFTKDPRLLNRIPGTDLYGLTIKCYPPLTLFYTVNERLKKLTLVEIHRFY